VLEEKVTDTRETGRQQAARRHRFEVAWEQQRPRVVCLMVRLTGDVELAEDLPHKVAVGAFQVFAGFRGEAGLSTWLYRRALNVVNRHRERRQLVLYPLDAAEVAALPAREGSDPAAATLDAD
jgi:DNA-directed RNA polymerase specialized sigma24 family protein